MSSSWIKKLNESNSRLHKEDVIKQALVAANLGDQNSITFLRLVKYCYDPFIVFGVRQIQDTENLTGKPNPWSEFEMLLQQLSERTITGNIARSAIIDMSKKFDSEEWNLFCAPVLRKDLRCGVSDKTINKICKKTIFEIPSFGCQLATNCENRPEMKGLKRLEPKLDGVRVLMIISRTGVVSYSRNGKQFDNFSHIEKQIMDRFPELSSRIGHDCFVFDGEVVGKSFQDLMKQARRKEDAAADDCVFHVFDFIPMIDFSRGYWNANLETRLKLSLDKLKPTLDKMPNVDLLPHIMVDLDTSAGKDQFDRYCRDMVEMGYEGVMIKDLEAPYECKRTTSWLKYKPVYDYDLKIVDVEIGTGRNSDRLGSLVCEGVDDDKFIKVNVGSGFSDEQRTEFWENREALLGQSVVVLADAITKNQDGTFSLRFPRFKCFRTDK